MSLPNFKQNFIEMINEELINFSAYLNNPDLDNYRLFYVLNDFTNANLVIHRIDDNTFVYKNLNGNKSWSNLYSKATILGLIEEILSSTIQEAYKDYWRPLIKDALQEGYGIEDFRKEGKITE